MTPQKDDGKLARVENISRTVYLLVIGEGESRVAVKKCSDMQEEIESLRMEADEFNTVADAWKSRAVEEAALPWYKEVEKAWAVLIKHGAIETKPTDDKKFNRLLTLSESIEATLSDREQATKPLVEALESMAATCSANDCGCMGSFARKALEAHRGK